MEEIEELYTKNKEKYIRSIRKILRNNESKAEDIVQNAFVRAIEYWPTYDPSRSKVENWFSRILFNELNRYIRKDRKHNAEDIDKYYFIEGVDYNEILENYYTINSIISSIQDKFIGQILRCIYLQGYSVREASKMCHTSESNIKQVCKRFRENYDKV